MTLICATSIDSKINFVSIFFVRTVAVLEFAETLDFRLCPVNHTSKKTCLLRNVGLKATAFSVQSAQPLPPMMSAGSLIVYEDPFTVSPMEGPLEPGESVQMTVLFNPKVIWTFRFSYLLILGGHSLDFDVQV